MGEGGGWSGRRPPRTAAPGKSLIGALFGARRGGGAAEGVAAEGVTAEGVTAEGVTAEGARAGLGPAVEYGLINKRLVEKYAA